MLLRELTAEIAESIRTHHASGHFSHATAHARLVANVGMSAAEANAVLASPVEPYLYNEWKTYPPDGVRAPCGCCEQALA